MKIKKHRRSGYPMSLAITVAAARCQSGAQGHVAIDNRKYNCTVTGVSVFPDRAILIIEFNPREWFEIRNIDVTGGMLIC